MPERCPSCHSQVEHPHEEVMTYCPNISCPSRILESIVHFASRSAMDIRGLGYERVRALLDAKLIEDVADLYELTPMQLLTLEGFAERSAQQLVEAIAASQQQPLSALLFALGVRHVGAQGAKLLARHFGTMKALESASAAEIGEVRGIGAAIAEAVAGFFTDARNKTLLKRLKDLGLTLQETATARRPDVRRDRHAADAVPPTGARFDRGRRRACLGQSVEENDSAGRRRGPRVEAREGHCTRRLAHRRGGTLAPREPQTLSWLPRCRSP